MTPSLLVLHAVSDEHLAQIRASYETIYAPDDASRAAAVAQHGPTFKAVMTIGSIGLTAEEIAVMPKLEFICALGAGYESIDVAAARSRGIALVNGAGANDACVADHAMGLLLAVVRQLPKLDAGVRKGLWRDDIQPAPTISGKRLGILGLGTIGKRIAKRAAAFDITIGYHNRRKQDVDLDYFDSVTSLAQWADLLIIATPGGAATKHLVNAEVLHALGPRGFVVNIARGSVIDTAALADALRDGTIAGAGIDVYESEPDIPTQLVGFDNIVLTPHIAGWSPESRDAMIKLFLDNADCHFSGRPLLTPI